MKKILLVVLVAMHAASPDEIVGVMRGYILVNEYSPEIIASKLKELSPSDLWYVRDALALARQQWPGFNRTRDVEMRYRQIADIINKLAK